MESKLLSESSETMIGGSKSICWQCRNASIDGYDSVPISSVVVPTNNLGMVSFKTLSSSFANSKLCILVASNDSTAISKGLSPDLPRPKIFSIRALRIIRSVSLDKSTAGTSVKIRWTVVSYPCPVVLHLELDLIIFDTEQLVVGYSDSILSFLGLRH